MRLIRTDYPPRLRDVRGSLVEPVSAQVILAIFSGFMLDGGFMSSIVAVGVITHWTVVGMIAVRRRNSLTNGDVVLIRYGYLFYTAGLVFGLICISTVFMLLGMAK